MSGHRLVGRAAERDRIDSLVDAAARGTSGSLVVVGEPGSGKSTLLRYAAERAAGGTMTVLRTEGVEPEADLPFAGLHRLLLPLVDLLDNVAAVQADALRAALGLGAGQGNRLLVAAGVLSLLSEGAERGAGGAENRGLLALVDDAQWLDRESFEALSFAARRLDAEGVVLLFAARDDATVETAGIPRLPLAGLSEPEATALLREPGDGPDDGAGLAPPVVDRLVQLCAGNPLALREVAAGLTSAQRLGLEPLPADMPLSVRIRNALLARVNHLPEPTRRVLLLAAMEPSASLGTLAAAAAELGLDLDALEAAERAGVVEVGSGGVRFAHPLLRSAIDGQASFARRRAAHAALASSLGAEHPDRWAWHRAAITDGADPVLADELERSAERARARSGFAATASALERSADLTAEPQGRARRLLAAASAAWDAGQPDRARRLLTSAELLPLTDLDRAGCAVLQGVMETHVGRPTHAVPVLRDAAVALAGHDPDAAMDALILAVEAASIAGDYRHWPPLADLAEALPGDAATPVRGFLRGLALLSEGKPKPAAEPLSRFAALLETSDDPRRLAWGAVAALTSGDPVQAVRLYDRAVELARRTGALAVLPWLLENRALLESAAGDLPLADADATESLRLATELGLPRPPILALVTLLNVAMFRGDLEQAETLSNRALDTAERHGLGLAVGLVRGIQLELALGLGRVDDAVRRADEIARAGGDLHPMVPILLVPARVEALVRAGRPVDPAELAMYRDWVTVSPAARYRPLAARCEALVAPPEAAGAHYEEALRLHEQGDRPFDHARTRLLYGEALRRQRQVGQARAQLRAAVEAFDRLGCRLWADRARTELRAAGESAGTADVDAFAELTPQELQIVRLVSQGMSNRQVAAQLFLSTRTVEYHLYKVYPKVGMTSRAELIRVAAARLATSPA